MSETLHLSLPFLEAAQAQKHVTLNAALMQIDALLHLTVEDEQLTTPPLTPAEGERWIVATPASGAWMGREGQIASWLDGAWMFFTPRAGWTASVTSVNERRHHDGTRWRQGPSGSALGETTHAARLAARVVEADHTIVAGAFNDTGLIIPDRAIVLGVTGRVLTEITGPTSWQLGVAASATRYGNMIGTMADSSVNGVSGSPTAYYAPMPVRLTGTDGALTGGSVRLALHYFLLDVPSA
ncbi:MAG: DUF2793 domain-containing protein [Parvibaculum sp.]